METLQYTISTLFFNIFLIPLSSSNAKRALAEVFSRKLSDTPGLGFVVIARENKIIPDRDGDMNSNKIQ